MVEINPNLIITSQMLIIKPDTDRKRFLGWMKKIQSNYMQFKEYPWNVMIQKGLSTNSFN